MPLAAGQKTESLPAVNDKADLSGKRVLLVDDTVQTLESLAELLASERAQVTIASTGADAIKCAKEASGPYDLIISDIGMPGMDGYMLLAELRKIAATATTPAIALTGFTRPRDVDRALQAGYQLQVHKPVVIDQFIALAAKTSG